MDINMKRVGALIKRDWILYKRNYLVGIIILIAMCMGLMFLVSDEANPQMPTDASEIIFFTMLFVVGTIHTLRSFREFRNQTQSVAYLSIPASHMEKFLSRWIITLPLFVIVCSVVFVMSYPLFSFFAEKIWGVVFLMFNSFRWTYFIEILFSYVFFHSVFLFFAICFNRNTILKSIIVFILLWLTFALFSYYINNGSVQADDSFKAMLTSNYRYLMFLAVPIFWFLSYNRLKAKTA